MSRKTWFGSTLQGKRHVVQQIMDAVERNRPGELRHLLAGHAATPTQLTAAMRLALLKRSDELQQCVAVLLEAGADADATDGSGWPLLLGAAEAGCAAILRLLLEHGADPGDDPVTPPPSRPRRRPATTPLHRAAARGHYLAVQCLLDNGAAVDAVDGHGKTPAMLALRHGHTEVLRLLLARGADPARRQAAAGGGGLTLMHMAVMQGNLAVVRHLVRLCPAGVDVQDTAAGTTPLMVAAAAGDPLLLETLLPHSSSLDLRNVAGETALLVTAKCEHLDCLAALVEAGADMDVPDARGGTVLAAVVAFPRLVARLLHLGARADVTAPPQLPQPRPARGSTDTAAACGNQPTRVSDNDGLQVVEPGGRVGENREQPWGSSAWCGEGRTGCHAAAEEDEDDDRVSEKCQHLCHLHEEDGVLGSTDCSVGSDQECNSGKDIDRMSASLCGALRGAADNDCDISAVRDSGATVDSNGADSCAQCLLCENKSGDNDITVVDCGAADGGIDTDDNDIMPGAASRQSVLPQNLMSSSAPNTGGSDFAGLHSTLTADDSSGETESATTQTVTVPSRPDTEPIVNGTERGEHAAAQPISSTNVQTASTDLSTAGSGAVSGVAPSVAWTEASPLLAAAAGGHTDSALWLLLAGADPAVRGADGRTPLQVALSGGRDLRLVRLLFLASRACGADLRWLPARVPEAPRGEVWTWLHGELPALAEPPSLQAAARCCIRRAVGCESLVARLEDLPLPPSLVRYTQMAELLTLSE